MWLDRLSSHPTPSGSPPPTNRAFPPPARRASHLAPTGASLSGFTPRSSSLSLASNESSASLPYPSRNNASGLKQTTVISNAPNPLVVLERLLGPEGKGLGGTSKGINGEDPNEESEFRLDFDGMSLREFLGQESAPTPEPAYIPQTVDEYEKDKEKFEDLHRSIFACDDILNSVEINLASFRNDLAAVSAEIETLQARSTALSVRLENRKLVERGLGPVVEEISVAPVVVRKIVDGPIDETWVRALAEVDKRVKSVDGKGKDSGDIKGINDLKPLLENLVNKAIERIRDFLVAQIKALRSPNINAQIVQQQHFVRYKELYAFLYRHHQQLADEIGQAYLNTMRWYFLNQFTRYQKALDKVSLHNIDRYDVLGQDDGSRKSGSILPGSKSTGPPHDAFNLGRRIDLLKTSNQCALSSFLAEEDKTTHYLEFSFRNFNLALVDNASAEYSFLTTFFSPSLSSGTISQYFNYIFEPTFALGHSITKTLIIETYDCFALLLCVRLTQHFAFELQRRKIPAVEGYINGTNMLLWPRFQVIMDQHCESVKTATSNVSTRKPSAAEQAKQSAAPHFMVQRFGQFLQGILSLSTEAGDDEPLSTSLLRLRGEIEAFLEKTGKTIGEKRKRERFLYNNYSLILTIIGDTDGKLALEQKEHFEALKAGFTE